MDFLNQFSGPELVGLASILSIYISQGLTSDEINVLAVFITTLGDNLGVIAATKVSDSTNNDISDNKTKSSDNLDYT